MTRLPHPDRDVRGVTGPGYVMPGVCVNPWCENLAEEQHHVWRRSFLAGTYWWVELSDLRIVGNVVPVCKTHHGLLTTNRSRLVWDGSKFFWSDHERDQRPLSWQPEVFDSSEAMHQITHEDLQSESSRKKTDAFCPQCGQVIKPHLDGKREKPVVRKSWSVAVPVSEQEAGADVLDTLLEEARKELARAGLPYGAEDTVKYHILATSLALFVTNAEYLTATEGG
jgi:hypothetical protein